MDLAVGVIIGAAFGKIVDSAVKDLIMPVVGAVIGKIDFSSLYIKLAVAPAGVPDTLEARLSIPAAVRPGLPVDVALP